MSFRDLLEQSLDAGDPFLAAACHPYADLVERRTLENLLFATPALKRRFAGALYTPTSVLDRLARDCDRRIRLRVAKHPATGSAALTHLAGAEGTEDLYASIARHRNTTSHLLDNLYHKRPPASSVRLALCHNPNTALSLLKQLAVDATPGELKGVARHSAADGPLLRQCWLSPDKYLRAEVVAHPNCPPDILSLAERSSQALIRRKFAQNPLLADTVLIRLLEDAEAQVRAAAVRSLSSVALTTISAPTRDPSHQVRRDQARHPGLPLSWIKRLARDTDPWVRRLVARNPAVPAEILHHLAGDVVTEVRRGVARNPACPVQLLGQLAGDPQPWVRAGVALREDTTQSMIIGLSRDDDLDVLSALGRNPGTPINILRSITHHDYKDVRRAVILNRDAPRSLLRTMLGDPYPLNRVLLAGHPNVAAVDLKGLLQDPEATVRFAAAQALAARLC